MSKVIYDYDLIFKDNNNAEQNVIFCHGFNSSPNSFKLFQNYWTKTNYYALQFPGCNKTAVLKDHQISIYQYAKLLIEFVKNNNLKNITLIGHSMGCMIISIAYMNHPDLFNKLIKFLKNTFKRLVFYVIIYYIIHYRKGEILWLYH